jgi:hypothetical protein
MSAKKKVVKKVAKKKKIVAKKPKLKAVRGTTKGTKGQAKLKVQKKERLPRVGSTVIFTFKRGNERKDSWGLGTITSVVGPMANVQVGGEEYGFNVIVAHDTTYKPTPIEASLHQFVIDAVFKSRKMKERELELDEKSFKKSFTKVADVNGLVELLNEREKEAEKVEEQEAPKADDLSVLYAAYANQPKAQQVIEQAVELAENIKAFDIEKLSDKEVVEKLGHFMERALDVIEEATTVQQELDEQEKLAIVEEVQKAPLVL